MINAPSLLNCNALSLADDLHELVEAGIDFVHIDIMDGHYVPNLAFSVSAVADIKRRYPDLLIDVHLMVDSPAQYLIKLADAGADWVSFHSDSTRFVHRTIQQIRACGMKAGVALNPSQSIDTLTPFVKELDYVNFLGVEPGFVGQTWIEGSTARLEQLGRLRQSTGANFIIEVDGGVNYEVARACIERGADILVTGVFVTFNQPDGLRQAVHRFAKAMSETSLIQIPM